MATVSGAAKWKPNVSEDGDIWRVSFTCPRCGTADRVHVQAGTKVTQLWCLRDAQGVDVELAEEG